jgi:AcrR family transcriptional regulator
MKRAPLSAIGPLIAEKHGNIAAIARALGVSRGTIHNRIDSSPRLKVELEQARQTMLDHVESALYAKVLAGDTTAMIFWLKTQGKRRGWVERTEVTGADGGPIKHADESEIDRELARLCAEMARREKTAGDTSDEGETEMVPVDSPLPVRETAEVPGA